MSVPIFDTLDEWREQLRRQDAEPDAGAELLDHAALFVCSDVQRARSEVELARRITAVATSGVHRDDGHTTVAAWCRAVRRWSEAETRTRVRFAKLLADFPDLVEVILDGRLGVAQAHTLAKAAANPRCGDQLGESLGIFLEHADKMPHADFQRLVNHWERIADADGAHRDADQSHRQRHAVWGTDDDSGDFHLHLRCGAAQGAQIRAVLDAFTTAEFRADWAACVAEHGPNAAPGLTCRTDAQRRADAIIAMAMAAASAPADGQRPEPLVNLIVDHDTLIDYLRHHTNARDDNGQPDRHVEPTVGLFDDVNATGGNDRDERGAGAGADHDDSDRRRAADSDDADAADHDTDAVHDDIDCFDFGPDADRGDAAVPDDIDRFDFGREADRGDGDGDDAVDHRDADYGRSAGAPPRSAPPPGRWRTCSTTDGQPAPVADAVAAMFIGRVRVVITDERGVILRMGRTQRLFTGRLREAVMLAAHECVWSGCNRPASQCEADHAVDWQHAGATDVGNGAPLCPHHNRFKNHGFRIHRDPAGHWHTYRPNGSEI